jgi:hypothetical protein
MGAGGRGADVVEPGEIVGVGFHTVFKAARHGPHAHRRSGAWPPLLSLGGDQAHAYRLAR